MTTIDEIKEKFENVQKRHKELNEKKIALSSELKTLKEGYEAELNKLLQETGTSTLEEAEAYCNKQQEIIESETEKLDTELGKYLQTYKE